MSTGAEHFWHLPLALMGVWDFDGYAVGVNPLYESVLGWTAREMKSRPFWEFIHPADRDRVVEDRERLLSGAAPTIGYWAWMQCRDGMHRHVRWCAAAAHEERRTYAVGLASYDGEFSRPLRGG